MNYYDSEIKKKSKESKCAPHLNQIHHKYSESVCICYLNELFQDYSILTFIGATQCICYIGAQETP